MKWLVACAFAIGSALPAWPAPPATLTTLHALHALSNEEAAHALPVAFEATVTYFRSFEHTLFVQDGNEAIYVYATTGLALMPGDRILIRGTSSGNFHPFAVSDDITLLRHGPVPRPRRVSYADMISATTDCLYVVVRGRVRSADVQLTSGRPVTQLDLLLDGGDIAVTLDSGDRAPLASWLDAEVEITGAASGQFDGKMQQVGILVHSTSARNLRILRPAAHDPWSIPLTPMDKILRAYHLQDNTTRVRVEGTITYYREAQMAVLQDGPRSIQVFTPQLDPLRIGDRGEAIGIPTVQDGFLTLKLGALRSTGTAAPIAPLPVQWRDLVSGKHAFDLISTEGTIVSQVREHAQDVYVISTEGHLFSASIRHPYQFDWGIATPMPPLPRLEPGSKVRVTGILVLDESNPFNGPMAFGILLRSAADVQLLASPPWLNVTHLTHVVSILLIVLLAIAAWGWALRRQVRQKTTELAVRIEAEASLERRRSSVLESINGNRPLAEIVQQITDFVSLHLDGAPCWCEFEMSLSVGVRPRDLDRLQIVRQEIASRSGKTRGALFTAVRPGSPASAQAANALSLGAWLATMAIDTRGLYSDLVHRSDFDLLTDVYNRFSLERLLDARLESSLRQSDVFGLIYIDLDEFKQVNDLYGHQAGDLYLQEAASRMKSQLRSVDALARIGGDEFAVLVPSVRNREEVEEIALRLDHCFIEPFRIQDHRLHAAASFGIALFPEDGQTSDALFSAADAAMYVSKNIRKESRRASGV